MKMKYLLVMMSVFSLIFADESKPELKGPISKLSSTAGGHIEKIKSLGSHAWLDLGAPLADEKWGVARGRAWSPKMAFAENLNAAFFCATGVHGYVKPDGHYMDDLWAYDVNANAWICLYPGASKSMQLKLDENGFERTLEGDHQPVSYCSHGYNNMTYIPETKEYMLTYRNCPWWGKALPQRADWLEIPEDKRANAYSNGKLNISAKHPIFYSAKTGKWERRFVEKGEGVSSTSQMGVLEYIPSKKKVFYLHTNYVAYYDPADNSWSKVPKSNIKMTYDINGCFDSKRNRVVIAKGNFFKAFNTETDTWEDLKSENQPESLPTCNRGNVFYDSHNDAIFVFHWGGKSNPPFISIHYFETGQWERKEITWPDGFAYGNRLAHGFYHPGLNAHFLYFARDSDDKNTNMLVYRIK